MSPHIPLSRFVYHPERDDRYTRKEIRIILYFLCDYSVKEIAAEMHIHEKAVYQHRWRIICKSEVHSFEAVIAWVLLVKIFTPEEQELSEFTSNYGHIERH